MKASVEAELSSPTAAALAPRLQALTDHSDSSDTSNQQDGDDALFVVTVSHLAISSSGGNHDVMAAGSNTTVQSQPRYAAVFLPATVTESALEGSSDFIETDPSARQKLSKRLLHMAHPFLGENCSIHGVLQVRHHPDRNGHGGSDARPQYPHTPADVALVDLSHTPPALLEELILQTTTTPNGQQPVLHAGPELILKIILIYSLHFVAVEPNETTNTLAQDASTITSSSPRHRDRTHLEIPSCPVCIHRIDPMRLGLPQPDTLQLCSKFCAPPNLAPSPATTLADFATDAAESSSAVPPSPSSATLTPRTSRRHRLESQIACPQQRLLLPWPSPSFCVACRTIDQYWQAQLLDDGRRDATAETATGSRSHHNRRLLVCGACAMQQTLWVCLTCGFLGCGRYSNKHAATHFMQSGHPFSLELATLRIWDYVTGGFVQRTDLLECPSSWPLLQPWVAPSPLSSPSATARPHSMAPASAEKTPKKATMIGEEYEVLLQSALEEQAQHYEGELSHLQAQLAAEHVDQGVMTESEQAEVEALQAEIAALQIQIDRASRQLLDTQAAEAGYRSASAQLLRQQQVSQDLVQKLEQETAHEQAVGRQQVEELEQQIADLTANQRMRHQFTQNEELQQAQIWGMTTSNSNSQGKGKKGKKPRRGRS